MKIETHKNSSTCSFPLFALYFDQGRRVLKKKTKKKNSWLFQLQLVAAK